MMIDLKPFLTGYERLAIIGVGSELRGDDAVGLVIAEKLKKSVKNPKVDVFTGGTTPENHTGVLKRNKPSHVLLIDVFHDIDEKEPIKLIDPADADGMDFSTHSFSFATLAMYIEREIGAKVLILGIKARSTTFGDPICAEVLTESEKVSEYLRSIL